MDADLGGARTILNVPAGGFPAGGQSAGRRLRWEDAAPGTRPAPAVTPRYTASWNQVWTGTERKQDMKVTGKTLTWTTPTFKLADGKEVVYIFTADRTE